MDDDDDQSFSVEAECIAQTAKALKVRFEHRGRSRDMWVPKSVVHDDSEVFDADGNAAGKLVIKGWFAREEGLSE